MKGKEPRKRWTVHGRVVYDRDPHPVDSNAVARMMYARIKWLAAKNDWDPEYALREVLTNEMVSAASAVFTRFFRDYIGYSETSKNVTAIAINQFYTEHPTVSSMVMDFIFKGGL